MKLRANEKVRIKMAKYDKYPSMGYDVEHSGVTVSVMGDQCKVDINGTIYNLDVVDLMVLRNPDEEASRLLDTLGYCWCGYEWKKL